MKETIPARSINNRLIVIEIRYLPVPTFIDKRGTIIDDLMKSNIVKEPTWELGDGAVQYSDKRNTDNLHGIQCTIDIQRFLFTDVARPSNEVFYKSFEKAYDIFRKHVPVSDTTITRIGCRIIGTYTGKSTLYDAIFRGIRKTFPSSFFFDEFPVRDIALKMVYQNGMYEVGPIKDKDDWTNKHFPNDAIRKNSAGFGIDTDNYIVPTPQISIKEASIKDALMASLSVEKLLFEKLSEL